MDLILWRHAEAEGGDASTPDEERALTKRGRKQARKMAKWLRKRLPKNTRILVSPTKRTRQTAKALGLPFEIEPRIGVGADCTDLLAASDWMSDRLDKASRGNATILVGHQPTLGQLAALLLSGQEANWTFAKGAVWWFSRKTLRIENQVVLQTATEAEWL